MVKNSIYFFFLSIVAIFTYNLEMTDTHILPKWLYTLGMIAIVGMIESVAKLLNKKVQTNEMNLFAIVSFVCLCQAVYAIMQALEILPSCSIYQVVGSFDNPAGLVACLSVGLPCCIYLYSVAERKIIKWVIVITAIFIVISILLSKSRTGMLAGLFLPIVWWLFSVKRNNWFKVLFLGLGIVILSLMYILKKESADGRLLMLRCGWEMIKDKPLFGHGVGSVEAHYMDYQADWLKNNPDTPFSFLADNVKKVFNEYLAVGIRFGVTGWLVLVGFVWLMVYCYRKNPTKEGECALMSLAVIGVLGCFSYPLTYPFTWVVLFLDSSILLNHAYSLSAWENMNFRYSISVILFIVSVSLLYGIIRRTYAELEWGHIVKIADRDRGQEFIAKYESLLPVLGNEPYFLYNYSVELYVVGNYEKALLVASHCRKFWADYDLELLHGELFDKLDKSQEAERHFKLASQMCPVRFIPLFRLYMVYKDRGDQAKAIQIGKEILQKPIKVESITIKNIKKYVKMDLQCLYSI